jgi:hypothetical protein
MHLKKFTGVTPNLFVEVHYKKSYMVSSCTIDVSERGSLADRLVGKTEQNDTDALRKALKLRTRANVQRDARVWKIHAWLPLGQKRQPDVEEMRHGGQATSTTDCVIVDEVRLHLER